MFFKTDVLKEFAKFTGKHLYWSLYLFMMQVYSFTNKRLLQRCFPVTKLFFSVGFWSTSLSKKNLSRWVFKDFVFITKTYFLLNNSKELLLLLSPTTLPKHIQSQKWKLQSKWRNIIKATEKTLADHCRPSEFFIVGFEYISHLHPIWLRQTIYIYIYMYIYIYIYIYTK